MIDSKKIRLALLFAVTTVITARIIGSVVLPIYDDAFITFRYARNFASGIGLVYHPGEWVLGLTGPLYGVLISSFYFLKLQMPRTVVGMNIAVDAITAVITFLILARKSRLLAAVLFGVFFAASPIMNRICVGGMEANLFLLCSVVSIFLYHRGAKKTAVMLAAASYFLRPEAVLLVLVLLAMEAVLHRKEPTERYRVVWLALLAIATVILPLLILYDSYGHILPQSLLAKSEHRESSLVSVLKHLVAPDPACLLLLPLAVWGLIGVAKERGFVRTYAIWSIVYFLAYLVGRPSMWSWYGLPVHYAVFLLSAIGGARILRRLFQRELPPQWVGAVGGVCTVAIWAALLAITGRSAVTKGVYEPLELWCRQNNLEHSSILAPDIGAVGYFSNARIYDTAGLVWPEALAGGTVQEMIETYSPDYVFLNKTAPNAELMNRHPLGKSYELAKTFLATEIARSSNFWSIFDLNRSWVQEYLVFKKVGD